MIIKKLSPKLIIIFILLFTALSRFALIWYPDSYVFDEVYHAFTAKEYARGSKEAWEWWTTPPAGVAYEWTHPPLAKEIMAFSMLVTNSQASWAWRLPAVIFGIISVYLVYKIGLVLLGGEGKRLGLKQGLPALLAAFLFSIDGLNFVQSRIGMNDIYFVTFMLASVFFALKDRFFFSAVFVGLAISSKWAALYLAPILLVILITKHKFRPIFFYLLLPGLIYLLTYLPFFLLGHSFQQFIDLHKQMWWYHTHLKATHDYASPWWSWPFNLYPVWYFVKYYPDNSMSNIFASGNPVIFWVGIAAVLITLSEFIKTRTKSLLIILAGYFAFLLPWAISPRIMFLYHYCPSIPFLSLILGYQFSQITNSKFGKIVVIAILALSFINFILFYPILVGIPIPRDITDLFFKTNLTKNPFAP